MENAGAVIFACGNLSRGDDAIGPLIMERLEAWLEEEGLSPGFALSYNYQLQLEDALELKGRNWALFIDAGTRTPAPFSFYETKADGQIAYTSHILTPEAVLAVWNKIESDPPPPAFVLCVRGDHFALGEEISDDAKANMDAAFSFLQEICRTPDAETMRTLLKPLS